MRRFWGDAGGWESTETEDQMDCGKPRAAQSEVLRVAGFGQHVQQTRTGQRTLSSPPRRAYSGSGRRILFVGPPARLKHSSEVLRFPQPMALERAFWSKTWVWKVATEKGRRREQLKGGRAETAGTGTWRESGVRGCPLALTFGRLRGSFVSFRQLQLGPPPPAGSIPRARPAQPHFGPWTPRHFDPRARPSRTRLPSSASHSSRPPSQERPGRRARNWEDAAFAGPGLDSSGFIFDLQSNTVLAQGGVFENMKEKINAVRAIVPNKSNNEIILVLQHFDNCVDKTVQAFMEGSASEVLKEWTVTGKKKNKKKKSKPKPAAETRIGTPDSSQSVSVQEEQPVPSSEKGGVNGYHASGAVNDGGMNGYHASGATNDAESVDSLSEGLETLSVEARELEGPESAAPDTLGRTRSVLENGVSDFEPKSLTTYSVQNVQNSRNAAKSLSRSTSGPHFSNLGMEDVPLSSTNKKLGSNIEKSVKDLQRCTVSLARYRVVVKEEMDASIKKMKQAFAELQSCLMDREVALLAEMDKVKAEAMEILLSRQKKAELLKKMTDVAVRMSEEQLVELRADIKHFVSERKYDEDLGRVARFTCDVETLKKSIDSFGQVSHPKNSYSTRSRCNSVIPVSLSGSSDACAASSSTCASAPSLTGASKRNSASGEAPAATANSSSRPCQPHREVLPGNRRGQGYRPQGQKSNDAANQGRHDSAGHYRNSSWYSSGSRYQSAPSQAPGNTSEQVQAHSAGTSGNGATMEPSPSKPSFRKGLPQRKPRTSQPRAANS
ncbi:PREDICTED: spermatogenesis-associated serine-rich protein 2 isoform X2 [Chinchilla lanigera]|uniref:spermatogenesis-associated serine-rich protein 2 isoform X2 n=1 Tax=Chinchilla lanigera TaxID=34839 RepID=UPI000697C245|nr:PREDICTED: spermatogenesis-associated serine-rich protein 2 isoform X2 [Chinchilla lanigera]